MLWDGMTREKEWIACRAALVRRGHMVREIEWLTNEAARFARDVRGAELRLRLPSKL
jgi:hypothetical protein